MYVNPWQLKSVIETTQMILNSYEYWQGHSLCSRVGNFEEQAKTLFFSPFVVACHDIQSDPLFCYGNQKALEAFETDWDNLMNTHSRQSTEPIHQTERAEMLKRVSQQGFISGYQGIRISCQGNRFRIEKATIWNVQDGQGMPLGQAVTFTHWQIL